MDKKQSQKKTPVEKSTGTGPRMENELSDQDLEFVVGGVSFEMAWESFQQLLENWNQDGHSHPGG